MPNTKSAEKRARSSVRKAAHNRSVKSKVKTLEKSYLSLVGAGKLDEAKKALNEVASAYDKAAKSGSIKKQTASRKRSRLQLRLNAAAKPAAKPAAVPAKS
jgi:small subunit ribosomal protein S20